MIIKLRFLIFSFLFVNAILQAGAGKLHFEEGNNVSPHANICYGVDSIKMAWRNLDRGNGTWAAVGHTRRIIDNEAGWVEFWMYHGSSHTSPPERPKVDFSKERVIVIADEMPNSCGDVFVSGVFLDKTGVLVVRVVRTFPEDDDIICAAVVEEPYHFIAIKDRNAPLRFEEYKEGYRINRR